MDVNKVKDVDKLKYLIAVIGSKTVDLLVSLCTPVEITRKAYMDLLNMLDNHYKSGDNTVNESVQFDMRTQKQTESVSEYIVAISDLSIHCGFGEGDALYNRLRNRLITGVRSTEIREALMKEASKSDIN